MVVSAVVCVGTAAASSKQEAASDSFLLALDRAFSNLSSQSVSHRYPEAMVIPSELQQPGCRAARLQIAAGLAAAGGTAEGMAAAACAQRTVGGSEEGRRRQVL